MKIQKLEARTHESQQRPQYFTVVFLQYFKICEYLY